MARVLAEALADYDESYAAARALAGEHEVDPQLAAEVTAHARQRAEILSRTTEALEAEAPESPLVAPLRALLQAHRAIAAANGATPLRPEQIEALLAAG